MQVVSFVPANIHVYREMVGGGGGGGGGGRKKTLPVSWSYTVQAFYKDCAIKLLLTDMKFL